MMALNHSQARQWIELAADGLLDEEQQQQLKAHLQGCADCQAYAAELAALEVGLSATLKERWPAEGLPKAQQDQLVKKLQAQTGGAAANPWSWLRWLLPLGLGASFILWLLLGSRSSQPAAGETPSETATASQTATETTSPTQTASDTPTPAKMVLVAIPQQTLNCRYGNGSQFDIADTLQAGVEYTPEARGHDEQWVRFAGPSFGHLCWVFVGNLDLLLNDTPVTLPEVSEEILPYASYPPTPTPTEDVDETYDNDPTPYVAQCSDGIDNDGDQRIDFDPNGKGDLQCRSANDNDESQ